MTDTLPDEPVARPRSPSTATLSEDPVMARLRGKIMAQLELGVVAEMAPDVLRGELEPLIHSIADRERVQLSARDQERLAQD